MVSFRRGAETRGALVFGAGAFARLAEEPAVANASSILVLVSGSAYRAGQADRFLAALSGKRVTLVTEVGHHVPSDIVAEGVRLGREAGAELIVSIGGGSAIGLGKAVSVGLGDEAFGLPHIAVTTTYSGSEQTARFGVTDAVTRKKNTITDLRAFPVLSVYDPELTYDLPAPVTAGTGLNALAHCIEIMLLDPRDPECRIQAREGTRRIVAALPTCVADPHDPDARAGMLLGSMLAARVVIMLPTALHHVLCQLLGGRTGLPHGTLNAVVLPSVVAFNAEVAAGPLREVAADLGLPAGEGAGERAAAFLHDFNHRLGLPGSLRELGVDRAILPEVAEVAFTRPSALRNPKPLGGPQDILPVLERAWAGVAG